MKCDFTYNVVYRACFPFFALKFFKGEFYVDRLIIAVWKGDSGQVKFVSSAITRGKNRKSSDPSASIRILRFYESITGSFFTSP